MAVLAVDALEWHSAPMPGSNRPVELARLPQLDDQAFRAFVRFPVGWTRPGAGHYAVPEEFLILDGDLSLNGIIWNTGGYAWIPARHVRSGSSSVGGCLAFAWFGGMPRWVAGEASAPASEAGVSFAHWRDAPMRPMGDDLHARELRGGTEHSTWIVERVAPQPAALPDEARETLCLRDNTWSFNEMVEPTVGLSGPMLVRVRSAFGSARRRPTPIRPAYNSSDR